MRNTELLLPAPFALQPGRPANNETFPPLPQRTGGVVRRVLTVLAAVLLPVVLFSPAAQASSGGYTDPPFRPGCQVHHFGEGETPPWWLWLEDPLCVDYLKRDITFDDGGALEFLLAEPARFAVALAACRYWQTDHWSVQTTQGATALVAWDGSYWFDKRAQTAAARLTNFRINGQSVGIGDVVIALRDSHPSLADALARYGTEHGETGLSTELPYSAWCSWQA
ncbi:hypothetical protein KV205_31415 [Streptomyces sp. SKN60]|uniref:hypothetical protein n=1 Tax=Streptomyces sp. SKN60 TaxID=2855506 RepID=UPI0022460DFC|nr:hypothetical protein [Streptomyces sp. SKN60]MCX2184998.1 hypothetical protein [Streptomyces sp. SKN60]